MWVSGTKKKAGEGNLEQKFGLIFPILNSSFEKFFYTPSLICAPFTTWNMSNAQFDTKEEHFMLSFVSWWEQLPRSNSNAAVKTIWCTSRLVFFKEKWSAEILITLSLICWNNIDRCEPDKNAVK